MYCSTRDGDLPEGWEADDQIREAKLHSSICFTTHKLHFARISAPFPNAAIVIIIIAALAITIGTGGEIALLLPQPAIPANAHTHLQRVA